MPAVRIARFEHQGSERLGVVEGGALGVLPQGTDLMALLALDPEPREQRAQALVASDEPVPVADVHLLAPLVPRSFRDFITFEEHAEGVWMRRGSGIPDAWYEIPTFYFTNPIGVLGARDDVQVPPGCKMLDFELEVAEVVAREGENLTVERARECIAGYTIFNDWSARDIQWHEMQIGLGPAKGKDFAGTLGPWIVTADELEPYRREDRLELELEVWLNGVKVGDDTLANMGWSFEELLVYASRGTRVLAGDVFGSGTCGTGCLAELWGRRGRLEPPPLAAGDVVAMAVEGIGAIENRVLPGPEAVAVPRARPPSRRARADSGGRYGATQQ